MELRGRGARQPALGNMLLFGTVLGMLVAAVPVSAAELWDPHLRGIDEGLAAGAALPPGFYGIWDQWYSPMGIYDSHGHGTGTDLDVLVEAPILFWQSDFTILGGAYSAAIAEPFDFTDVHQAVNSAHWGTYNTLLIPGQLAWELPNDFHVKAGLTVYLNDASSYPGHPDSGAPNGVGSGNGYWTFQPDLGVSWMRNGWDFSVNFHYAANLENPATHYQSGDQVAIDYTVMKAIGQWSLGLGGYTENQIMADSGAGAAACASMGGCKAANAGIGPLVQYNFGPVIAMAEYNAPIYTQSDVGGSMLNVRLIVPF